MMKKRYFYGFAAIITAIVVIAIIGIGVTSCSGPEGPMGPEGPQGPAGSTGSGQDGSDGQDGADGRPATPVVVYTVTFDSGEDGSVINPEKLMRGGKVTKPEHPARPFTPEQIFAEGAGLYRTGAGSGWIFLGWFLNGEPYDFDTTVTADITLTAHWAMPGKISTDSDGIDAVPTSADFFDKALAFVVDNPASYYLVINQDYTAQTGKIATAIEISLTIVGLGSERTITANQTDGNLFIINNGAQLYLDSNITLKGKATPSTTALIVITNGSLTMQDGSKITGHTTSVYNGTISLDGTWSRFVMNGGEISGNRTTTTTANSAIVLIRNRGNFTMNGGTITGNTVAAGGCINLYYINNDGTFTMNGGTITGNTNTNAAAGAGGVYSSNRIDGLTMTGGSITGNTAPMGDVYTVYNSITTDNLIFSEGNAAIGTLTVIPSSGTGSSYNTAPITISGNWTGSVQVLNLYATATNTTFANVATQFTNKFVLKGINYTLTGADVDKFKEVYIMRGDLATQPLLNAGYAIVKSGTTIGRLQ